MNVARQRLIHGSHRRFPDACIRSDLHRRPFGEAAIRHARAKPLPKEKWAVSSGRRPQRLIWPFELPVPDVCGLTPWCPRVETLYSGSHLLVASKCRWLARCARLSSRRIVPSGGSLCRSHSCAVTGSLETLNDAICKPKGHR